MADFYKDDDDVYKDSYGNPINPNLIYGYEEEDRVDYSEEEIIYAKELYEDASEEKFLKFLKNSQISPHVQALLSQIYYRASSKDIVLGYYTRNQQKIDLLVLERDLAIERMNLKGEDILARLSGAWDTAGRMILAICRQKYNRSIDGFERKMQREMTNITINEERMQALEDRKKR